jgi:hypothetical protein
MTKEEAISLMKAGHKLKHEYFQENEWVTSDETGTQYLFEDGIKCPHYEFWEWRKEHCWEDGWELFE